MRRTVLIGVAVVAAMAVALPARAEQAGGADNPMAAQWQKFQADHKSTLDVSRFFEGMMALETTDNAKLDAKQAKQVLDLITPLTKQPKLSQADARTLHKKLQAVLTAKQATQMMKMEAQRQQQRRQGGGMMGGGPGVPGGPGGGPGGGGPPPGGGGGAPGRAGGGTFRMDFDSMKNFNPFYLPKKEERAALPRMILGRVERFEGQLKQLKEKAGKA